jgi:heat shock protein HtpX
VAQRARVPRPRVYLIEAESPNAFATGRDPSHAAVAVTKGILRILTERELAGVLAHELGHVRNRDTLIMTVVATVAGAITLIANMAQWALLFGGYGRSSDDREGTNPFAALLMIIVAPIAAMLIQLAISRSREYEADATAVIINGDPLALASALEKLEQAAQPMNVSPAVAHLFIVNPFDGRGLQSLFMTHTGSLSRWGDAEG